jgi:hypothetical protein
MGCQHTEYGLCVKCEGEADACCGEDFQCQVCGEYCCNSCYHDFNEQCPVCAKEIVTDSQLVTFLLKKFNLDRQAVVDEFRAEVPVYRSLAPTLINVRPLCESSVFYEIPARMMEKLRLIPDASGRDIMDRSRQVIVADLRLHGQDYRVIHGFFDKNAVQGQNNNNDDMIEWGAFGVIAPTVSGSWTEWILYQQEYNEPSPFVTTMLQKMKDARMESSGNEQPTVQQTMARQVMPGLICYVGELAHLNSEYDLVASEDVKAAHAWYQKVTKNGTDYSASWWRLESDESEGPDDEEEEDQPEDDNGGVKEKISIMEMLRQRQAAKLA